MPRRDSAAHRSGTERRSRDRGVGTSAGGDCGADRRAALACDGGRADDRERVRSAKGGRYLATVSVGAGLLRGGAGFLSGYVLVAVVLGVDLLTALQEAAVSGGGPVDSLATALGTGLGYAGAEVAGNATVVLLKLVGWVFLAGHQVAVVDAGAAADGVTVFAGAPGTPTALLTPVVYHVIPPLLLAWLGFRVAIGAGALSPATGILPGASIALGYVPVAVLVATLVGLPWGTAGSTVGPSPVTTALFTGGYACLFGALGGLLGGAFNDASLATAVGP